MALPIGVFHCSLFPEVHLFDDLPESRHRFLLVGILTALLSTLYGLSGRAGAGPVPPPGRTPGCRRGRTRQTPAPETAAEAVFSARRRYFSAEFTSPLPIWTEGWRRVCGGVLGSCRTSFTQGPRRGGRRSRNRSPDCAAHSSPRYQGRDWLDASLQNPLHRTAPYPERGPWPPGDRR